MDFKAEYFGLSPLDVGEIRRICPETAAHNVASACVASLARTGMPKPDEHKFTVFVLEAPRAYIDAYNYAFNLIQKDNEGINEADE